ncbi:MAG: tetratricopeptide repeat protein [Chitinophagales bacterium]
MKKNKLKSSKNFNLNTLKSKSNSNNLYLITCVLLFISAILLYGHTIYYNWGLDDMEFIYNPIKKIENNWDGIKTLLSQKYGRYDYRPVTLLIFWIESKVFGQLYPGISHFINAIIYGLLIVQIFRFVTIAEFFSNKQKLFALALLTSIIFLVHPVHVSVVANIKSRDNLLSMLLGITSTIQFLLFFKDKKWYRFILIILLLVLAQLAKQDAYSFFILPILYFFIYKYNPQKTIFKDKSKLIFTTIFFLVVIISSVLIIQSFTNMYVEPINITRFAIDSPLVDNNTFINKLSFTLTTLFYYLKFMIIPHGYYFYYGYNQIPLTNLFSILNALSFLAYSAIFILCIKYFKKEKIYLFSFLFFMIAIAYAANFFVIVSGILMDRYSFIASLGFTLGISALIINISKINNWKIILDKRLLILFTVLITATVYRTTAWKDLYTLFDRDIPHLKNSAHAQAVVGGLYINSALFDNYSKSESDKNIKIGERYIDNSLKIYDSNKFALESKGIILTYFNKDQEAKHYLKRAIQADSNYTGPYNNLGIAHRNLSEIDSALIYFKQAMDRDQLFSYAAENYIDMLLVQGRYDAVDSTVQVLLTRFPKDKNLKRKVEFWYQNNKWEF